MLGKIDLKKTGFTLAEILITLAIIGVVAAITIPTLISKYQISQWENKLKKSYATVVNGFHLIAAEHDGDLRYSGLFDDIDDATFSDRIDTAVRKHFKVVKSCKIGDVDNCPGITYQYLKGDRSWQMMGASNGYVAYLYDGTIMKISNSKCAPSEYIDETKLKYTCARVVIDINGESGPNTNGKDFFQLRNMNEKGDIYPDTSLEWAKSNVGKDNALSYEQYWRNKPAQCGTPDETIDKESTGDISGSNCLARIMENGWKMDYLK